jgi:antitoxin component YwqK of YwqJK toxin-antitoxin module
MWRLLLIFLILQARTLDAQVLLRKTWHDADRRLLKEVYQVKDTVRNIRHGRYTSYFLNGSVESTGFYENNQPVGLWEFFYENGNLKMRGQLKNGTNAGYWEYFFENGGKSMEGTMNGHVREESWTYYYEGGAVKETGAYRSGKRHGLWLWYFEDGVRRAEGDYTEDYAVVTEYFHSGKVAGYGPKMGSRKVGHWRYYHEENGSLTSEGTYSEGKKHGEWLWYFPSGQVSCRGYYERGDPVGEWTYYHENGQISQRGQYINGEKDGYWVGFSSSGNKTVEIQYDQGSGLYKEYFPSGKLKVTGMIRHDKREGRWVFYREDGSREGECTYKDNRGRYEGYYSNGALHTRGDMEGDRKTGLWEIYDMEGNLTGFYRPFYDHLSTSGEFGKGSTEKTFTGKSAKRGFSYFVERTNEFKGIVLGGNPMLVFAGRLPMAVEFYNQERLGHEFEFVGIREPFFTEDDYITPGKLFKRGYSMAVRQKFYHPLRKVGMWYFAHELRFSNIGHFINVEFAPDNIVMMSAAEQRIQYGVLVGYRVIQRNNRKGFTIDLFMGTSTGYRSFDQPAVAEPYFQSIRQKPLALTFQAGMYVGHMFSAQ